jgi:uncharacterized membrane protein YqjE
MESRILAYILLVNISVLIFIMNYNSATANKFDINVLNNYVIVNPVNIWRLLDANEKETIQRFVETIEELTIDRIKCFRYDFTCDSSIKIKAYFFI